MGMRAVQEEDMETTVHFRAFLVGTCSEPNSSHVKIMDPGQNKNHIAVVCNLLTF